MEKRHVQSKHEREEETEENSGDLCIRTHSSDALSNRGVVQRENHANHKIAVSSTITSEPRRPIPAEEV